MATTSLPTMKICWTNREIEAELLAGHDTYVPCGRRDSTGAAARQCLYRIAKRMGIRVRTMRSSAGQYVIGAKVAT
jgi:hypothetical protein